ncbi:MAG: hypothetical protein EB830_05570 [Nitrosopumilus sp. H13]|nr:MAG: hypothetical protein EB830_05570 [Nitrosopumilus sp. H13]
MPCMIYKMLAVLAIISVAQAFAESPREQMERGVAAEDVTCREGLELVIRSNHDAACVREETALRMQDAGIILAYIGPTKMHNASDANKECGTDCTQDAPDITKDTTRDAAGYTVKDAIKDTTRDATVRGVPASGVVDFYIADDDLNTEHGGVERVHTAGLVEFAVNNVIVPGPGIMVETGPDTGVFRARLHLPDTLMLAQGDVVTARYLDESDRSGNGRTLTESVVITSAFARVETTGGTRIGHEFAVRLYEPDANRDSRDEDKIPLERLEFRTEGRIKTTLAHPGFDANSANLIETGPDTGIFEVVIEIPRYIDGKTVHIGHWYEIRYIDRTNPAGTPEKVVYRGTIGTPRN